MRGLLHHLKLGLAQFIAAPALPEKPELGITAAVKSVQGSRCKANEDSCLMDEARGVFVLADGLGGQYGGERASRLAATGLMHEAKLLLARPDRQCNLADAMTQAFVNVNESILSAAEQLPRFRGMAASAVLAVVDRERLYVAAAGDCRAYLIRDEEAERLTADQSLFQLLRNAGLAVDDHETASSQRMLWSCLGNPKFAPAPVRCEEIRDTDRLVLVTNGITRVLKDGLIGRLSTISENALATVTNVVNAALSLKTGDDATCLAVSFGGGCSDAR